MVPVAHEHCIVAGARFGWVAACPDVRTERAPAVDVAVAMTAVGTELADCSVAPDYSPFSPWL